MLAVLPVVTAGIVLAVTSDGSKEAGGRVVPDDRYCSLIKSYKESAYGSEATASPDAGSHLAHVTELIQEAKRSAPPVIRSDVEVVADAYEQVASALADVGNRPEAVGADALTPLQTPKFEAALQRIAEYDKRACQIG